MGPVSLIHARVGLLLVAVASATCAARDLAAWDAAIASTYSTSSLRNEGDGITTFYACFHTNALKQCDAGAFGKKDAFKNMVGYTTVNSELAKLTRPIYLGLAVVVSPCDEPSLVLNAQFWGRDGWLFLNRASVLADGKLVIDREFSTGTVSRNPDAAGVIERGYWAASAADVTGIKSIATASSLSIRLTGDRGYVTVTKKHLAEVKEDAAAALVVYDKLTAIAKEAMRGAACRQ